jgi:hypothetical protein
VCCVSHRSFQIERVMCQIFVRSDMAVYSPLPVWVKSRWCAHCVAQRPLRIWFQPISVWSRTSVVYMGCMSLSGNNVVLIGKAVLWCLQFVSAHNRIFDRTGSSRLSGKIFASCVSQVAECL